MSARQRLALLAYAWLWRALLPLALLRLIWRGRREPLYRQHLLQRLGYYPGLTAVRADGWIWVHAVSLGETRAAQPLLQALRAREPGLRLLLTHTTATGREAGAALLRDGDLQLWLPYDLPGATRRFLRRFRPRVGVLIETEVWPQLGSGCAEAGVPLLLANARMSARSAARWQRWPTLAGLAFGSLRGAAAQTVSDAERLRRLGVEAVEVCGNLKFEMDPDPRLLATGRDWRAAAGARPVLLMASTREEHGQGEEALLLDRVPPQLLQRALLVVVPRHPQRWDAVEQMLRQRGLRVGLRSDGAPTPELQVWLGNSLGEMPAYYAMADACFVGGSLLPLGGQNLIEACACGCPVVMGPHQFHFAAAAAAAQAAGALVTAADSQQVWAQWVQWLDQPQSRLQASQAALRFAAAHRGAARAQAAWILGRIAAQ